MRLQASDRGACSSFEELPPRSPTFAAPASPHNSPAGRTPRVETTPFSRRFGGWPQRAAAHSMRPSLPPPPASPSRPSRPRTLAGRRRDGRQHRVRIAPSTRGICGTDGQLARGVRHLHSGGARRRDLQVGTRGRGWRLAAGRALGSGDAPDGRAPRRQIDADPGRRHPLPRVASHRTAAQTGCIARTAPPERAHAAGRARCSGPPLWRRRAARWPCGLWI